MKTIIIKKALLKKKMKTGFSFMAFLVITTFVYPSLASDGDDKPLIDPNVDLDSAFAKSPSASKYNSDLIRKQSQDQLDYLGLCGEYMGGAKCNEEVISEILQNKPASKFCCIKMLVFGKECHTEVRKLLFESYDFKPFASKALPKIPKVWNRCCSSIGGCDDLY